MLSDHRLVRTVDSTMILNFSEKISDFFHIDLNLSIYLVVLLIIILYIVWVYLSGGLRFEVTEAERGYSKIGFLKTFILSLFSTIFFLFGFALLIGIPILYVKISDDGFNQPDLWGVVIVIIVGNYIFNKGAFFKAIIWMLTSSGTNSTFNPHTPDLGDEKSTTEKNVENEVIK